MTDERSLADRLYPTMPKAEDEPSVAHKPPNQMDAGQMSEGKYDHIYPSMRPENKGKELKDENYEDVYKKAARERKAERDAEENKEANALAEKIANRLNLPDQKKQQAAEAGEEISWEDVGGQWEAEAEKEFSDVDLAPAREVLKQYGDPELAELVDSLQLGNHPAVIRFMMNLASKEK